MGDFKNKAHGFDDPTGLPKTDSERADWLKANKEWWETQPMRYDFTEPLESSSSEEFTREFYEEIDRRFFDSAKCYAPWNRIPFDTMIDFDVLAGKRVLEIGVGNGSHALLLARHAKEFVGIDLTDYAVNSTRRRMEVFGMGNSHVQQMNVEAMSFPDNHFDFVWSWGVIHHTADTDAALREIRRVLKPGAKATLMVYYRSLWYTYVNAALLHGVFKGYWLTERSLHRVVQRTIDGAIARFYRVPEWEHSVTGAGLKLLSTTIMGQKSDLVLLPAGRVKDVILELIPHSVGRLLTNKCRMGYFLVSTVQK